MRRGRAQSVVSVADEVSPWQGTGTLLFLDVSQHAVRSLRRLTNGKEGAGARKFLLREGDGRMYIRVSGHVSGPYVLRFALAVVNSAGPCPGESWKVRSADARSCL